MLELAASITPKRVSVDREARIKSGPDTSRRKRADCKPFHEVSTAKISDGSWIDSQGDTVTQTDTSSQNVLYLIPFRVPSIMKAPSVQRPSLRRRDGSDNIWIMKATQQATIHQERTTTSLAGGKVGLAERLIPLSDLFLRPGVRLVENSKGK